MASVRLAGAENQQEDTNSTTQIASISTLNIATVSNRLTCRCRHMYSYTAQSGSVYPMKKEQETAELNVTN